MRWAPDSWWAYVADPVVDRSGGAPYAVSWCDDPASLLAARVDLVYRAAHAVTGTVPHTLLVGVDGTIDCWWPSRVDLPAPFRNERPDRWSLPADVDLLTLAEASRRGAPDLRLVTTVGVTDQHRLVLVDLAHWRLLGVQGQQPGIDDVLRALVAGCGAPPLASAPTVCWGGVDPGDIDIAGEVCDDAETALEVLAVTDSLPAVAVIDQWLAFDRPESASGRAVLGRGRPPSGLVLDQRNGLWTLEPHHLAVMPVGVSSLDLPDLSGDHQTKEQPMTPSAHVAPSVHRLIPEVTSPRRGLPAHERPWPLMVSVLGPPRVVDQVNEPVDFDRSKALELVVWLAVHRPRCTRTGARSALWDVPIRDGSFANIVCEARRCLGRGATAPPGTEWIGRGLGDELPLHPHVVTDADLLRTAIRSAHAATDAASGQRLGDMLRLVRGVPFEGTSYLWADAEGLTSELTMLIVQAAAVSARRHLESGDLSGVFEATAVGLRVVPRHEELIALRLRAHHRSGDDAGVRLEWSSYERALALDPFSSRPSSKLLALRQELLRRPVSA